MDKPSGRSPLRKPGTYTSMVTAFAAAANRFIASPGYDHGMLAHLDAVTGTANWQHVRRGNSGGPSKDGASLRGLGLADAVGHNRGRASVGVTPELANPQGLSFRACPEGLLRHVVDISAAHPVHCFVAVCSSDAESGDRIPSYVAAPG